MEEVRSSGGELLKLMVDIAGDGVWPTEALCPIVSASARLRESQEVDLLAAQKALPGQHVFGPAEGSGPRCHASGGKRGRW